MIPALLGYIAGLATAAIIVAVFAYFRKPLMTMVETSIDKIESFSPSRRGYIFDAEDDIVDTRREIIAKNSEQGKSTRLSDLP